MRKRFRPKTKFFHRSFWPVFRNWSILVCNVWRFCLALSRSGRFTGHPELTPKWVLSGLATTRELSWGASNRMVEHGQFYSNEAPSALPVEASTRILPVRRKSRAKNSGDRFTIKGHTSWTSSAGGSHPSGFLTCTADGRMMAIISDDGRKPLSLADRGRLRPRKERRLIPHLWPTPGGTPSLATE
jgi:hypothetical protein